MAPAASPTSACGFSAISSRAVSSSNSSSKTGPAPPALSPRKAGADAAPDGYTLLMTGNNTAIATALFKSLPFHVLTDFASVSTAAFFDLLIVTRAGSPLHSVGDLIKAAQANPGKLNIGTIIPGSTQNLAALLFTSTTGIKATVVTVPHLARHGQCGDARRYRCRLRILCGGAWLPRPSENGGAGIDRHRAHGLSAGCPDRHRKRHQGLRRRQLERAFRSRRARRSRSSTRSTPR